LDPSPRAAVSQLMLEVSEKIQPRLLELGEHPDGEVRRHAISILGKLGARPAVPLFERIALGKEGELPVRLAALVALGRIPTPEARSALARAQRKLGWYER